MDVQAGETVLAEAGARIRYLNPSDEEEAEYWAVCTPAFSPDTVHREEDEGIQEVEPRWPILSSRSQKGA